MNQILEEQYKKLGISKEVLAFGEKIEQELKERFAQIDAIAELNNKYGVSSKRRERSRV